MKLSNYKIKQKQMRTLLLLGVLFFSLNNAFAQEVKDTAVRLDQYGKVVKRVPLGVEARNGILQIEYRRTSCFWRKLQ